MWHDVDDEQIVRLDDRDDLEVQAAAVRPDPDELLACLPICWYHGRLGAVDDVQSSRLADPVTPRGLRESDLHCLIMRHTTKYRNDAFRSGASPLKDSVPVTDPLTADVRDVRRAVVGSYTLAAAMDLRRGRFPA